MLEKKDITPQKIDELLKEHEGTDLEFKEAREGFEDDKLFKACGAMANTEGGLLLLGVSDKRRVVGTLAYPKPGKIEQRIAEHLAPPVTVSMKPVDHPDGRVVCFIIPQAKGLPVEYDGVYYKRVGAQTLRMPGLELQRLMSERKPVPWLEDICFRGLTPHGVMDLLEVQRFYQMMQEPWPLELDRVMKGLADEGILMPEQSGQYSITNMGMLLLAKSLKGCPRDFDLRKVRIVKHPGNSKTLHPLFDESVEIGHATGFDNIVEKIMGKTEGHYERIESHRYVVDFVPRDAVRELLANAIIHQDFSITKQVMVEIFSNRVVITNSGVSLTKLDRMIDKHKMRNIALFRVMSRCGLSEDLGSGIDKVVAAMEFRHAPPPNFESEEEITEVTLFSEQTVMDHAQMKKACYQHCVLKYVNKETMNNETFRERLNFDKKAGGDISKLLRELVDEKMIKRTDGDGGSRKYAKYVPYWA